VDETLRQVAELLLGAIPTIILLVLLFLAYRSLVQRRLESILAERYARTQGAIEKAKADIAAADSQTAEYEQRIRDAKTAIYQAQEKRRQQWLLARTAAIAQARASAGKLVQQARAALQVEATAARAALQAESHRLAAAVIRAVLKPVAAPGGRQP